MDIFEKKEKKIKKTRKIHKRIQIKKNNDEEMKYNKKMDVWRERGNKRRNMGDNRRKKRE